MPTYQEVLQPLFAKIEALRFKRPHQSDIVNLESELFGEALLNLLTKHRYDSAPFEVKSFDLLFDLLAERCQDVLRRKGDYFNHPDSKVNQMCELIAKWLSLHHNGKINFLQILIPILHPSSIKKYANAEFSFKQFILSDDDEPRLIHLVECVSAAVEDAIQYGQERLMTTDDEQQKRMLTDREKLRVVSHSWLITSYYGKLRDLLEQEEISGEVINEEDKKRLDDEKNWFNKKMKKGHFKVSENEDNPCIDDGHLVKVIFLRYIKKAPCPLYKLAQVLTGIKKDKLDSFFESLDATHFPADWIVDWTKEKDAWTKTVKNSANYSSDDGHNRLVLVALLKFYIYFRAKGHTYISMPAMMGRYSTSFSREEMVLAAENFIKIILDGFHLETTKLYLENKLPTKASLIEFEKFLAVNHIKKESLLPLKQKEGKLTLIMEQAAFLGEKCSSKASSDNKASGNFFMPESKLANISVTNEECTEKKLSKI
jgi:hypothetical protein